MRGMAQRRFEETGEVVDTGFTWGPMRLERVRFNELTGAVICNIYTNKCQPPHGMLIEIQVTRTGRVRIWGDGKEWGELQATPSIASAEK